MADLWKVKRIWDDLVSFKSDPAAFFWPWDYRKNGHDTAMTIAKAASAAMMTVTLNLRIRRSYVFTEIFSMMSISFTQMQPARSYCSPGKLFVNKYNCRQKTVKSKSSLVNIS
jgi:hypothetical protein